MSMLEPKENNVRPLKEDRVYCEDCIYLQAKLGRLIFKSIHDLDSVSRENLICENLICGHKSNITFRDTWLRKQPQIKQYNYSPELKNRLNNCTDFALKEESKKWNNY